MKAMMIALAGLATLAAGSASADETVINKAGMTGPEVVAWLQAQGYKAALSRDKQGDPMIKSATGGVNFTVYFYDCDNDRCRALQFSSGFDLKDGMTLARTNEWNKGNRYLKAWLDDENDPYIEYDVNVNAGRTFSGLSDDLDVWSQGVGRFTTFIDW